MADKVVAIEPDSVKKDIKKIEESVNKIESGLKSFKLVVTKAYSRDNIEPYKVFAKKITNYTSILKSVRASVDDMYDGLSKYVKHFEEVEGIR